MVVVVLVEIVVVVVVVKMMVATDSPSTKPSPTSYIPHTSSDQADSSHSKSDITKPGVFGTYSSKHEHGHGLGHDSESRLSLMLMLTLLRIQIAQKPWETWVVETGMTIWRLGGDVKSGRIRGEWRGLLFIGCREGK